MLHLIAAFLFLMYNFSCLLVGKRKVQVMEICIKWRNVPEIWGCRGIISRSRKRSYRMGKARAAVILAELLVTTGILIPMHAKYTERDIWNYSTNEMTKQKEEAEKVILPVKTVQGPVVNVPEIAARETTGEDICEFMEWNLMPEYVKADVMSSKIEVSETETMDVVLPKIEVPGIENIDVALSKIEVSGMKDIDAAPPKMEVPGMKDMDAAPPKIEISDTENVDMIPPKTDVSDVTGIVQDKNPSTDMNVDIVLPKEDISGENAAGTVPVPEDGSMTEDVVIPGDDKPIEDSETGGAVIDDPKEEDLEEIPDAVQGFLIDEEGMIYGINEAALEIVDGYLELPSEGCVGIRSNVLCQIGAVISEIYLPANISIIEDGAFSGLGYLEWIEAASGNPGYMSIDGVLFDGSGSTLLLFPAGRRDMYVIPAGIKGIADGAFADTSLSRLDFWQCKMVEVGVNIFGSHSGNGIEVRVPEENMEWYQTVFAGYDVLLF